MTVTAFTCQRCGHCCRGQGGIVLTAADVDRLAAHLGRDRAAFLAEMTETRHGKTYLKCGQDDYCLFFSDGCGIHPARPDICRAWPFFRGNLIDAVSWEMIQSDCPGVNPEAGHEAFRRQGLVYLRDKGLARAPGGDAPAALVLLPSPEDGDAA